VSVLVQRGSNPYDSIALVEAKHDFRLLQVLLLALHNFIEPNSYDSLGREALREAIEKQNLVMAQAILGSPLRAIKSIEGLCDGLIHAVRFDSTPNFEMIRIFLGLVGDLIRSSEAKVVLDHYFKTITTAVCNAIKENDPSKVELLLEACGCVSEMKNEHLDLPAINCAISKKNSDILRKLLQYGLDPNKTPEDSYELPLRRATMTNDVEIIKILLQHGANPNIRLDKLSHTPLQIASRDGSREIFELLLEHGADVNAPPAKSHGATALQFAAIKGLLGIAFLLLENGADVNAPPADVGGRTALEGAAEHGRIDMVQLLLNAGVRIFEEGREQYENTVRRASENGHSAVQRLLESYHG
jgi:Ankyrin repeats (3 copies)/Ankyrin repeat